MTKIAQSEYERYAPTPKKQWVDRLNIVKSPKTKTPSKDSTATSKQTASAKKQLLQENPKTEQTPRTVRTKRAVKNLITGVSDRYHAFEQNVSQQLSQGIFNPRTSAKAIEN